jgi:excisionase family DNA binding protein
MNTESTVSEGCLLTVKEAAAKLRCAPATIYEQIRTGELIVTRIGRQKGYRIDSRDLDRFLTTRKFCYEPAVLQRAKPKLRHIEI